MTIEELAAKFINIPQGRNPLIDLLENNAELEDNNLIPADSKIWLGKPFIRITMPNLNAKEDS